MKDRIGNDEVGEIRDKRTLIQCFCNYEKGRKKPFPHAWHWNSKTAQVNNIVFCFLQKQLREVAVEK